MRAVAQDREIASLMGINVDRVIVITFAIGGVLAGIAGVLYSLTFEQVQFTMGFRPGIAAFTAAVLGGIGSIGGAALGGFVIGLLQAVGPPLILTGFGIPSVFSLRDAFVFLVLVLVLVFRPGGLLGHRGGGEGLMTNRWVRIGVAAGIVTIFLALVGLIGGFTDVYLIGDEVTFAG